MKTNLNDKYYPLFYMVIAMILAVMGYIRLEPIYNWASLIVLLCAFYWIWKVLKKV